MKRTYMINGYEVPSVTSLLPEKDWSFLVKARIKSILSNYYMDAKYINKQPSNIVSDILNELEYQEKKDMAIGEEVHGLIENYSKGTIGIPSCDEAKNAFESYIKFTQEHDVKIISNEQTIWHKQKGKILYAGKMDVIITINGKTYILDFKTGNASKILKGFGAIPVYRENKIQVCAYSQAHKSWKFEKNGNYEIIQKTGHDSISWNINKDDNYIKVDGVALLYLAKNTVSYRLYILKPEEIKKYTAVFNQYIKLNNMLQE